MAAHSAYDVLSMSRCLYLIVNLVFSHLGFWSVSFFLIAPFPDRSHVNVINFNETSRFSR